MQNNEGAPMAALARGAAALGISLSAYQLEEFEKYYHELDAWNHKFNLTAVTGYEEVQNKHFLDSLSVSLAFPGTVVHGLKLLDVGAGAGFPGLPLKILYPQINLTLLEATGKKAAFLEHLAGVLELENVTVLPQRAEEAAHSPDHREAYNIVVSRAVAELPSLLELTLPFCRPGGLVFAQKKGDIQEELGKSDRALDILGGKITGIKELTLPGLADVRYVIIISKTHPAPPAYPRRPGMPVKRPLL
jgi:16S rRNA (guanine527-N7)-methyltransferase